ncbi:MAG TPA: hypothetical protein PKG48_03430 [Bacteroidales bacterium]|nr:hypothetical protein [Bacteroidales bacterium]HPS63762.1 hypothetical protein [Bacteroidales bacterium]
MKKHIYISPVSGFLAGMILGLGFLGLVSFTAAPGGGATVTAEQARSYIANYAAGATSAGEVIKGFTIDRSQFEAMSSLSKENGALAGFRIYLGRDESSRLRGIVVGMDGQGRDVVNGSIFNTDAKSVSPCPPACEITSPLTQP